MHRRVYGRNGDVVILLCVIPPQYPSTALNQIIIYKVFIIQICILIFLKSLQSLFFAEFPTNGFFAPFLLKKRNAERSLQSRKFIKSLSNRVTISAKEETKNFFNRLKRVLYHLIMPLYIYVFYRIVHDNGMPSGKSSTLLQSSVLISRCKKNNNNIFILMQISWNQVKQVSFLFYAYIVSIILYTAVIHVHFY